MYAKSRDPRVALESIAWPASAKVATIRFRDRPVQGYIDNSRSGKVLAAAAMTMKRFEDRLTSEKEVVHAPADLDLEACTKRVYTE